MRMTTQAFADEVKGTTCKTKKTSKFWTIHYVLSIHSDDIFEEKQISIYKVVDGCDEKAEKSWVVKSMLDVNPTRQFGISLAANLTPRPAWILPIDGNNFITNEVQLFLSFWTLSEKICLLISAHIIAIYGNICS